MSVSLFAALERQIPSLEARADLRAATVAVYPHASAEDARKLWAAWTRAARPPEPPGGRARSRFSFNGSVVSFDELRSRLGRALGAGLTA